MSELDTRILTIVVPCYNAEKYLVRCVSGLESLEKNAVSILFINDGSIDSTKQLLENWVCNHENATVISKENGGYCSAINAGLDHCRTKYVMFLGVDDEIVPDGIKKVCTHLRENDPDILCFSTVKCYDDENQSNEIDSLTDYKEEKLVQTNVYALFRQIGNNAWILFTRDTSRCFKMSLVDDLRYFGRTGVSSDGCFSSIMAYRSKSFEFVKEKCYIWHLHHDSVSSKEKTKEKIIEEADVWFAYFDYFKKEYNETGIPDPIVDYWFIYKKLVAKLEGMNLPEQVRKHKVALKEISAWLRKNAAISTKSRLKLMFPGLYEFVLKHI